MSELNDDQLFEELLNLKVEVASDIDDPELMPIYDEYFSSKVFDLHSDEFDCIEDTETKASDSPCWDGYKQIGMKRGKSGKMVPNCVPIDAKSEKPLKDPKGGLTAAGRAFFKRTEGSDLKPGVKGAADTPEKMRRKGSFLTRFFTNPSGPMVDEKGRATRLALSATAWGERVPKNAEDAAKLAAKGKKLLERYQNTKKKDDSESVEEKQLPGQTIGQMNGAPGATAQGSGDGIDHDGDGMINDGTPQETRVPYKRQSADGGKYEKARRKFVRAELNRQKIKPNARVEDRSEAERNARARARAAFDKQTVSRGAQAQAEIGRANTDAASARRNQAQSDRLTGQAQRSSAADRKPADRIDNSPPARRIDAADRALANRGKTTGVSDAAARRGQTDSRKPTSADDRKRPDSIDNTPKGPARGPRVDRDSNPDPGFYKPQAGPPAPKRTPGKNRNIRDF